MAEKKDLPVYGWEEIMKHDNDKDCWVVLYGNVLNVTKFLNIHPGGLDPINDLAGFDITAQYEARGHSKKADGIWPKYVIGTLDKTSVRPKPKPVGQRKGFDGPHVTKPSPASQYLIWIVLAIVVLAVSFMLM